MSGSVLVAPTAEEFAAMPTVASQFPLVFGPGRYWREFTRLCNGCRKEVPEFALRGRVTRPFNTTYLVDAWGLCSCGTVDSLMLTHYSYRLPPDMTIVGKRDGVWCVWGPRIPWWQRLLGFFGLGSP